MDGSLLALLLIENSEFRGRAIATPALVLRECQVSVDDLHHTVALLNEDEHADAFAARAAVFALLSAAR